MASFLDIQARTDKGELQDVRYRSTNQSMEGGEDETNIAELLCIPAYSGLLLYRGFIVKARTETDRAFDAMHHAYSAHPLTRKVMRNYDQLWSVMNDPEKLDSIAGGDSFTVDIMEFLGSWQLKLHFVVNFQAYKKIHNIVHDVTWQHGTHLLGQVTRIRRSIARFGKYVPTMINNEVYREDMDCNLRALLMDHVTQGIEASLQVNFSV